MSQFTQMPLILGRNAIPPQLVKKEFHADSMRNKYPKLDTFSLVAVVFFRQKYNRHISYAYR